MNLFPNDVIVMIYKELHRDLFEGLNQEYHSKVVCHKNGGIWFQYDKYLLFGFGCRHLCSPYSWVHISNLQNYIRTSDYYNIVGTVPKRYVYSNGSVSYGF